MGVSIIIGGQWGSEGKGKTALYFSKALEVSVAVRVGGPNSGHTIVNNLGKRMAFQMLPVACVLGDVDCVLPAGSYINVPVLLNELQVSGLDPKRLKIHPNAIIISDDNVSTEKDSNLNKNIGSTESGTGAAVASRLLRNNKASLAKDNPLLQDYLCDTIDYLRDELRKDHEVLIEGTQGFGLSLLHSADYPYVTSRDTTASAFASEVGISPFDVKNIIMTIRAFPIRVAGNSGPLPKEIDWERITQESGSQSLIQEKTTVTKRIRRVAEFDASIVQEAIKANMPNYIVLNHCDYFDYTIHNQMFLSPTAEQKVSLIEKQIGKISYVGTGDATMFCR